MAKRTFLSTASTHNIFRRAGTFYGLTISPVAGSTVAIADLADQGATGPNMNSPTSMTGAFMFLGPFPASPNPLTVRAFGIQIVNGMTVAITSTSSVTVFYE